MRVIMRSVGSSHTQNADELSYLAQKPQTEQTGEVQADDLRHQAAKANITTKTHESERANAKGTVAIPIMRRESVRS